MFRSYFKLASRNFFKRKMSTGVQVIGLATGLACCTLVALYFRQELSFDRGFENGDRIYRVVSDFRDGSRAPTAPWVYASLLKQVILNEEAVKALGYTVDNVVGRQVAHVHDAQVYRYTVVGVMKDYHFFSLHAPIGPIALAPVNPKRFTTIIAKVRGRDLAGAIRYASEKWRVINAGTPFYCDQLSNIFRNDYASDLRQQQMMSAFTFIAILISCLGVLGLITYSVGQKAREIGIRKVIGARVVDIVFLFARQYLRLILVANLIAAPIGWYVMQQWLRAFAYHVAVQWWMFAAALGMGCAVTLVTLSFKTIRAALANPVAALRGE